MKEKIIIIGAGAIGRGYLPWVFKDDYYDIIFVDSNKELIKKLKEKRKYTSFMTKKNRTLLKKEFIIADAYAIEEFNIKNFSNVKTVFIAVGPRNVSKACLPLIGIDCPIVLLENDDNTVDIVKAVLNTEKVFFAVPDVITSNTASLESKQEDELALHTEDGELFVDEGAKVIEGTINYCSKAELKNQWIAKFYLHNTPHCIAAYLGALINKKYLHEAMNLKSIKDIVEGAMNEMLKALKLTWDIPHDFLEWYAEKEIRRFSNSVLYDPISRVAREPFRKLELNGRLIGAAQLCLRHGFVPQNILLGIVAALLFENKEDNDNHIVFIRKYLPPQIILTYLLKLRKGEVLETILEQRYEFIVNKLTDLKGQCCEK